MFTTLGIAGARVEQLLVIWEGLRDSISPYPSNACRYAELLHRNCVKKCGLICGQKKYIKKIFFFYNKLKNIMAERVGFEPTDPRGSTVFKTAAFGRSATSPVCGFSRRPTTGSDPRRAASP